MSSFRTYTINYKLPDGRVLRIYGGQTTRCVKKRFLEHFTENKSRSSKLKDYLLVHGADCHPVLVGEYHSQKELDKREAELIAQLRASEPLVFNLASGGQRGPRGYKWNTAQRKAHSLKLKARMSDPAIRRKNSAAQKAAQNRPEVLTKSRLSASQQMNQTGARECLSETKCALQLEKRGFYYQGTDLPIISRVNPSPNGTYKVEWSSAGVRYQKGGFKSPGEATPFLLSLFPNSQIPSYYLSSIKG